MQNGPMEVPSPITAPSAIRAVESIILIRIALCQPAS
jgi:hypothetical protein